MIEKIDYYNEIKDKLINNEVFERVKDYSKERNRVITYYEIGKLLFNAGKEYGKNVIKQYSYKLSIDIGKKYNERNLRYMRKFYEIFKDLNWNPIGSNLTWTNIRITMSLKSINAIKYYLDISEKYYLSKRQLEERIKNKEYERLSDKTKEKLVNKEKEEITDFIKEPIILNKYREYKKISELALKEIILDDLDNFLKQLGNGFCYIENEYKIRIGNNYNYIDILLFNIVFNCYVVVELKINKLTKQDIGQIQIYMNYINDNVKSESHDKTIDIIVCRENNKYLIKYSSDTRIHVTTYEIV